MSQSPSNFKISEFLQYLAGFQCSDGGRIPSLSELSRGLGISVATLREQLEVARTLGVVEVRPKTGIRRLPYAFAPAVQQSLAYAMKVKPDMIGAYADLRYHLEASYWSEAVSRLTDDDHARLRALVERAFTKLEAKPAQIPHEEHRELHLLIYSRLNNPFVIGLLEVYWDSYKEAGLDVYADLHYLVRVWDYHRKMVEAICNGDYETGRTALMDHMELIDQRAKPKAKQAFE